MNLLQSSSSLKIDILVTSLTKALFKLSVQVVSLCSCEIWVVGVGFQLKTVNIVLQAI